MLLNRQNKEKINHLKWFDILVLTLILWGEGIYTSTASYIALIQGASTVDDNLTFSATDNYGALALQAGLLLLALLYLWLQPLRFQSMDDTLQHKSRRWWRSNLPCRSTSP